MTRRPALWLSAALTALVVNGVAVADCGVPEVGVAPAVAAPGETVVFTGTTLRDGICYDSGCGFQPRPDKARPSRGVRLELQTSSGTLDLGRLPDEDAYQRTRDIVIPPGTAPGPATLRALRRDGSLLDDAPLVVLDQR
jgi:hypothetical protein